ncbi:hypothetical protein WCP94_000919 [Bilophila wadsworthia]
MSEDGSFEKKRIGLFPGISFLNSFRVPSPPADVLREGVRGRELF